MTSEEAIKIIEMVDICANAAETARDMAIDALKKQIPQKPVGVKRTGNKFHTAKCPRCGSMFPDIGGVYEYYDECEQPWYCGECGQAIDWECE